MRLKYISEYLSIKQFDDIELNDFTVITGVNGAGKSHLLNAIEKGSVKIDAIETENIRLYNYNDFNVVNIDFNSNNYQSDLVSKQQVFQHKSDIASQKFNKNRNEILDSFKLDLKYGNIYLDDSFIANIPYFNILNWTDSDKQYYRDFDVNNPTLYEENHSKIVSFQSNISMYQYEKIEDINHFIEFLETKVVEIQALSIIRNFGFKSDIKVIDEILFKEVYDLVISNSQLDIWNDTLRNKYPYFILDVIGYLRDSGNLDEVNPINLIITVKELYKEIEKYFKSALDGDTLKLIQSINGDNLLDYIVFDNGFFNLNDIAQEEKNFQLQKKQNDINRYLNSIGENVLVYTDEELYNLYGESPIVILNNVLNEYDVNGYEFRNSNLQLDIHNGMQNQNIHVYLFNKDGNYQTQLEALSSGERTLLALAFSVYKLKKKKGVAELLLMDELDSALHPSMSKRLINVLYNYFHKNLGVKIVISTHSPSTVAFAPEESLFVMQKDLPRLKKVSKDEALKELTIGVPSFSINYENRKQVFVESKYDVEYYNALYNIFKNNLNKDISLNFIASGDVRKNSSGQGISSCDVVKEVTKTLRNAGNNSIYGIIDWDLAKSKDDNPYVITLGFESRYSIENYILDPLFIGFLLIVEKIKDYRYFGINDKNKVSDLYSISIEECQLLINKIENDFLEQNIIKQITPKEHTTILEIKLLLSEEFATMQGHELEKNYFKVYPELNKFKGSTDNHFKNHLIKKVLEEFVDYISMDLLNVCREIQE